MSAFDIPKNLVALLGALALTVMLAMSHPAYADEDGELSTLRKLLSAPELSLQERRELLRALDAIGEEVADTSPPTPWNDNL